jgi:hypothetical protein
MYIGHGAALWGELMMIFRVDKKDYCGSTALEIVRALESDSSEYPHRDRPVRKFLKWSLQALSKQIPPRDMHLSKRMKDEELALSYLCLRDEYGAGQLLIDRTDSDKKEVGRPSSREN